jgi:hypothetical protein
LIFSMDTFLKTNLCRSGVVSDSCHNYRLFTPLLIRDLLA